jgi:hypothetical protein
MWKPILLVPVLITPLGATPADEELLKWVQERKTLERVTPKPVDMALPVVAQCIDAIPSPSPDAPPPLPPSPHKGAKFHIFASEPATLPVFDPWGEFPEGSLILKEKLNRVTGKTELFTGMWKREKDFFPEVGDWEFFIVDAEATRIVQRGKLPQCASCHEEYPRGDYVTKEYAMPAQLSGGRIVLHSSKAQVHGTHLRYEPEEHKNTLGYWSDPSDWASWTFDVSQPGTYKIHLWQGCGKTNGGSEVSIICAGQTSAFIVEDTGGYQNFKEREIGSVTFSKPGPQTLEVRPKTKTGNGVMDLQKVVLIPDRR